MATNPPHLGRDEPATPTPVESREETIERVVHEAEAVQQVEPTVQTVDPTSRSGFNRTLVFTIAKLAATGFAIGAVLGLVLSALPGPFEIVGRGNIEGSNGPLQVTLYALVMGVGMALIVAVIGSLILLAREDGRVEHDVERRTGIGPPPPAG